MKMRKLVAHAATAVALTGMALILGGCATAARESASSNHQAASSNTEASGNTPATTPPNQRLEKFTLCYELRRPRASALERR